jgi:hypothetical protein
MEMDIPVNVYVTLYQTWIVKTVAVVLPGAAKDAAGPTSAY